MNAPQSADPGFQHLQPLNTLTAVRRHLLFNQSELKSLRKGDVLFSQGDVDNRLYYLIEGKIELRPESGERRIVEAGSNLPLNPLQPHSASARALTAATVLGCERDWFDALQLPAVLKPLLDKTGHPADDQVDWLQRLLDSALFKRLPAANMQQIFSQCEALAYTTGQTVVSQHSYDGGFYIIQSGRCEVTCVDEQSRNGEVIAELGPGDWFGEVSLLAGVPHSMTVTMQSEGAMLRLQRQAFNELLGLPLLDSVDAQAATQLLHNGARWLDVRETVEAKADPHDGATHLPFSDLADAAQLLDKNKHYIVLCDSGARSAVTAFILTVQGYTSSWLQGGLAAARGHGCIDADSEGVTVNNNGDPLLQALRNELTGLLRQVDNAMRLKRDAETARREAERAAVTQMNAERERLDTQSRQVRAMFEQTQKLQKRLIEEKQRLYAGVRRREQAMDQRVSNLNAYIEQRVAEERERITEQYQTQEAEIERLQQEKQDAESRLQDVSSDKQQARTALEAEFDQFNQELKASEAERRQAQTEAAHEIVSQLGSELAASREEFSEYKSNKEKLSEQRARLRKQAGELSTRVKAALIDKQATLAVRSALQDEASRLNNSSEQADTEQRKQTDDALRAASERYNEAEQAHQQAVTAQQSNATALAQTEKAEAELLNDMNAEVETWLQEQARQPRSEKQEALIQRYEETMQRMQTEAKDAEEKERTRDDLLLSEINAELETIAESRARQQGSTG